MISMLGKHVGFLKPKLVVSATAFLAATSLFPVTANSVVDSPFFRALPLVVVIAATDEEANGGVAPVAVDFNFPRLSIK